MVMKIFPWVWFHIIYYRRLLLFPPNYPHFYQKHILRDASIPLLIGHPISDIYPGSMLIWIYFWALYSVPMFFVHPCTKHSVLTTVALKEVLFYLFVFWLCQMDCEILVPWPGIELSPGSEGASLVAQTVKILPAMQETGVQSLGWEDPLEKGMATHSSILA